MAIEDSIRFLEAIYGTFRTDAAVPAAAIDDAERRLGIRLPRALRLLYERTGSSRSLHASHNTLVRIDSIEFGDDHLIFYEENQAVVVWAIARSELTKEDPPVDQGQHDEKSGWSFYAEFRSLSEFAAAQGAWQAVQGGLPFSGVLQQPENRRRVDATALTRELGAPGVATDSMSAWLIDGGVVIDAGDGYVGLAARTELEFRAAGERMGIDLAQWDYATVRDG